MTEYAAKVWRRDRPTLLKPFPRVIQSTTTINSNGPMAATHLAYRDELVRAKSRGVEEPELYVEVIDGVIFYEGDEKLRGPRMQ